MLKLFYSYSLSKGYLYAWFEKVQMYMLQILRFNFVCKAISLHLFIYLFIYYELGCRNLLPFHMLAPYTGYFSFDIFMNLGTEFGRLSRPAFT